jgi:transcriptional regulator with XRE-family HTH domain
MTSTQVVSTKTRRLRHLLLMSLGQQELGKRIRQAHEEAGLTQSELAERLGLRHPQSISRYERGETEVPQKRLRRISDETEKPLSFFLADDLEQPEEPVADPATLALARQMLDELRALRVAVQRLEETPARRGTPRERDASN